MRRDDLKAVVDAAGLKGVDRRSVQSGTPAADAAGEQGVWNASSCQTFFGMRCAQRPLRWRAQRTHWGRPMDDHMKDVRMLSMETDSNHADETISRLARNIA